VALWCAANCRATGRAAGMDRWRPDAQERRRLDDDLIGLDRDDPDVQAFSEYLDRAHRRPPGFTVEGYLSGVSEFAESANRAQGPRRALAVLW
jgi:hypothetical protein